MFRRLGQYKYLFLAVILALVLIGLSGYFFAAEKSEPVYLNKMEQLMYDHKNQPPRYILTLPDLRQPPSMVKTPTEVPPANDTEAQAKTTVEALDVTMPPAPARKEKTLEDVLSNVPNIITLAEKNPTQVLRYISLNDDLTQQWKDLMLPKIDNRGRKPWFEYGKAVVVQPNFKKVGIVIKGMGFDPGATDKINKITESEISMSYSPYADNLGAKILSSRARGHETYVDLLLSSKDFLKSDSGPLSMSLTISSEEAIRRLRTSLSAGAPVGGVVVNEGIADADNQELLEGLLDELKNRGLLMVDATRGTGIESIRVEGLARVRADFIIEYLYDREKIRDILKQAERTAYHNGQVLIVIEPKPVIVQEIYEWVKTFSPQLDYEQLRHTQIDKPLALVPVSNLVVE